MIIESYNFGFIVIDGQKYSSDVIIFPEQVKGSWSRKKGHRLCRKDIKEALAEKPDVLVIGTGDSGLMQVPGKLEKYIKSQGIKLIVKRTKKVSNIYNELSPSKKVIAALHLTC